MNILIVRLSSLGDVVHNMPMVADILRHYPDAKIDWVVEEAYTSLVRLNPGVRKRIPIALRRWRKSLFSAATRAEMKVFWQTLRQESYDIVFDTQGLFKSGLVMQMARLQPNGKRVGLANGTEGSGYEGVSRIFHTMSVPVDLHTHAVHRARLVTAGALAYRVDTAADFSLQKPVVSTPCLPTEPYVVFFHGTAGASKQWASENWVQLGILMVARGMPILLPWGSDAEKRAAESLAAHIPNARVLPKLSMMDAVALAHGAALVVGVDTGLTHIAAAYMRPTIELYCDSPRWKTEGNWSENIINLGEIGQPPSVGQVYAAIEGLLSVPTDALR